MANLRKLFKLPVLATESGRQIGKVEEIIIAKEMAAVKALLLTKPDFKEEGILFNTEGQELYGIIFTDLFRIGADAVMVRTDKDVENLALFCQSDYFHYSSRLFDKPIYTETGFSLGVLVDIIFDELTGEINTYQISDGIFADILYGRRLMPLPKAQVVGKDMLIVPDNMTKLII